MPCKRVLAWLFLLAASAGAMAAQPLPGALEITSRSLRYAGAPPESGPEHRYPAASQVVMPWVRGGRPGVAARINELVFLRLLRLAPPVVAGATFTPSTLEPLDDVSQIDFKVARNDDRVLGLAIDMEQCGDHCTQVGETLLFDAQTGRRLLLSDLFTPAARAALRDRRNQAAMDAYDRALDALPPDAATTPDDPDDEQRAPAVSPTASASASASAHDPDMPDDDELRDYFSSCRSVWEDHGATIGLRFDLPATGGLLLDIDGCGGSSRLRSIDVSPGALSIPAAELAPLLTDYGRRVVLGQGSGPAPASVFGQVLHGLVGHAAITMYLDEPTTDWANGRYVYDRVRRPIELTGTFKDGTLRLDEDGGKGFTLHFAGPALEGQWDGGGKRLPVRLE
jgi:hypothetical protein